MSELNWSDREVSTWELTLQPLWRWAQGHPGTVAVGVLLLMAMLAAPVARKGPPPIDRAAEGVPLFI
jgi:hypothetical protein